MGRKQPRRRSTAASSWKRRAGWVMGTIGLLAVAFVIRSVGGNESASAKSPPTAKSAPPAKNAKPKQNPDEPQPIESRKLEVLAIVNGEDISRQEVAGECLAHYGKEMLEGLVNRELILEACRARQISVNEKEIQDEIDRIARKMSLAKDQFLDMLAKERGIKPQQYAKDIIWPTLALRKLAADKLTVTQKELDEGFESQFGPAIKARLIAMKDAKRVKEVHAEALANPDSFPKLAKQNSEDGNSAQAGGLVQPIRRHLGNPTLEKAAFALSKGEISPIIEVGSLHVFLMCEECIPAINQDRALVDPVLKDAIRDRKLRASATDVFRELQEKSHVQNVYNDPVASKQLPGVAALINDRRITIRDLAEECIDRHGVDVLEGTVHHHLLEQALRKRKLKIEDRDIDDEIARAAVAMGSLDKNGKADVKAWLERVTKEQGVTVDLYVHDAVWPTVALKKIVGDNIEITDEDIQRGFESNYGPRIRCRAIICNSQRKAQEVWDMARDHLTVDNFAKLAEKYSIDADSAALGGEVPPIQKFGGQPILEKEAFKLEPGELSGIIQVGETFIVMLCEGRTQPEKISLKDVKQRIYDDLLEKKQRLKMAKAFEDIKGSATIDNLLAGKVQSPRLNGLEGKEKPIVDGALRPAQATKRISPNQRPSGVVRPESIRQ